MRLEMESPPAVFEPDILASGSHRADLTLLGGAKESLADLGRDGNAAIRVNASLLQFAFRVADRGYDEPELDPATLSSSRDCT